MAAIRWDELDNQGDESFWWEALFAEPPYGSPAGILERLERERPAWHTRAACRDRPDLDWFSAADQDATLAVCACCPVVEPCAAAGQREGHGIWGGHAHRLAGTLRPVPPGPGGGMLPAQEILPSTAARTRAEPKTAKVRAAPRPCSDCGERQARSTGLCARCSSRVRRQLAGAKPRPHGKSIVACVSCGEERPLQGRGLCGRCYSKDLRRRAGVQPKPVGRKVVACVDCGTVGLIQGRGLCPKCYSKARRRAATS